MIIGARKSDLVVTSFRGYGNHSLGLVARKAKDGDETGRNGAPPSGGATAASLLAGVPRVPLAAPALFLALGNKKPLAIRAQEAGTRCLRDGPGGRRPQQRGNAPGAPPRGSRALAPGPASSAPKAWTSRRRPGPPARGWKTSGGDWRAPSSGRCGAGAPGTRGRRWRWRSGAGRAERGARRQRPGPAARRAGERALAAARRPSASSSPGASGRVALPRARRLRGYSGTRRVRACSDRELGAGRRSFLDGRLFCTEYSQNINHYFRTDSTICKLT